MADTFAARLAATDSDGLLALLRARPDVLVEPVPHGFEELAWRLEDPDSLSDALAVLSRDAVLVSQAVAVLGGTMIVTVADLARTLGAAPGVVRAEIDGLCARGLLWLDRAGEIQMPDPLRDHWSAEMVERRSLELIARQVPVDELRRAVEALGADATGLRKPELIVRLAELMTDAPRIGRVLDRLPAAARERFERMRRARGWPFHNTYDGPGGERPGGLGRSRRGAGEADPVDLLRAAGLVFLTNHGPEIPREVAISGWLIEQGLGLAGPPAIPRPRVDAEMVRSGARAAAQGAVRTVTTLLDEAAATPITALKKGGVGTRERARLARVLTLPVDELPLWIDLVDATGLLALTEAGYRPTEAYPRWRSAPPSHQWAELALAWLTIEHAPTSREAEDDKEVPPPLPLVSGAGWIRRATLRGAGPGGSVRFAGANIDWFFPLHGYEDDGAEIRVTAAIREAETLGVVVADVLSDLGGHLLAAAEPVAVGDEVPSPVVADLADRCAALLPRSPVQVVLQSDLTAVVSGQPDETVSGLLRAAAVAEARGAAGTWRFTAASVRSAMDAGWTADELLEGLGALSARAVPQPLEYLVRDVARRHGQVRVRGVRSCVVADEPAIAELANTRVLARLRLRRVAPTVLASPLEPATVLGELRGAGFYPVEEDETGAIVVARRNSPEAPPDPREEARAGLHRLTPEELLERLLADPAGRTPRRTPLGDALAALNARLSVTECTLLAQAVRLRHHVVITYRDGPGERTERQIRPVAFDGATIIAWCYLDQGERGFTVADIEGVRLER